MDSLLKKLLALITFLLLSPLLVVAAVHSSASRPVPFRHILQQNPDFYFTSVTVTGDRRIAPVIQQMPIVSYDLTHKTVSAADVIRTLNIIENVFYVQGLRDVHITASYAGEKEHQQLFLNVTQGPVNVIRHHYRRGYRTYILDAYSQQMARQTSYAERYYYYSLANQLEGVTTETYLEPTSVPGAYDLYTVGQRKRFGGFVGMDNTGIQRLGHVIYMANGYVNDIVGNDQLKAGGSFTSKTNKSQFFFTTYQIGVGSHGTQLLGNFTYNKSRLGQVSTYAYSGHGKSFTFEVLQPVYITPSSLLQMAFGYSVLRGRTRSYNYTGANFLIPVINIGIFARNATIKETIPTIYTQFDFSHLYRLGRVWGNVRATAAGHFLVRPNYRVTGGFVDIDFQNNTTSLATSPDQNSQKLNFELNDLVVLPDNLSLLLAARGQFAFEHPLPLGLMFGFYDGAFIGQGFLADNGVSGRTEMRWNWNIYNQYLRDIQFFGYYAAGFLRNPTPIFVNYSKAVPMTMGTGFRTYFMKKMNGFVEFAKPLRRKTAIDNKSGWRFFFGLGVDV